MRHTRTAIAASAALLAAVLAGCSVDPTDGAAASTTTAETASGAASAATGETVATALEVHDTSDALTWDQGDETAIELSGDAAAVTGGGAVADGSTVTITAGGTYRVSGTLDDGAIVVDAPDSLVRIVLDGAHVSSSTTSPLQVADADQVVVVLADGSSNSLADAAEYVYPNAETDEPNAALFSAADLTIGGGGSLTVTGNANDGIASKDGLVILSGDVTVTAVDDGVRGKDYLVVRGGSLTVDAGDDGLKSDNVEDAGRGVIEVSGGTVTVAAGDDAVKGERGVTVSGGTVDVTASVEGLESEVVTITGGEVSIVSSDDAINGADADDDATDDDAGAGAAGGFGGGGGMADVEGVSVTISGGTVVIDAEGDGLDSNGDLTISGGTVVVNGPTRSDNGALDANGTFLVTGGELIAVGAAGMAETPEASSPQSFVAFTAQLAAGTVVHVVDSSGAVLATFETSKGAGSVVYSSAAVTSGAEYTLLVGGTTSGASTGGLRAGGDTTGASAVATAAAGAASAGMGGAGSAPQGGTAPGGATGRGPRGA